ncbi:MAG: molybdopterin dinucleotide binding domain-containing protein, partial [Myxococcota bacterium]|nr:molybdopterin dinucleotide binding domain-containing protein [Myxococcota bacterium]
WGGAQLCANGDFANMPDCRASFSILDAPETEVPEGWFKMTTRRGKQFNSMVFSSKDTLQGGARRNDVLLSSQDAERLGLSEGTPINLKNDLGIFKGIARIQNIAPGYIQTYWPESNMLIERCFDPISQEPDYHCLVQISKAVQ